MPGELGNPDEQMNVGHYERRYVNTGEWNDPPLEPDQESNSKAKPKSNTILSVIKKFHKDK